MLQLSVLANYPTITPNTVVAKVVTPTSGNYTADGEPLDLTASKMLDPKTIGLIGPFTHLPIDVEVEVLPPGTSENVNYQALWVPGTTLANGKLQLFVSGSEYSGTWATWNGYNVQVNLRVNLDPSDQ